MLSLENLTYTGAMNPAGFIASANDLGASVANITDAALYFLQVSEEEGETYVISILSEIPVVNVPNGAKKEGAKTGGYRNQQRSIWDNLGDAVVAIFGGSTAEQMDLIEQNQQLQDQLAEAESGGFDINVEKLIYGFGGVVAIALLGYWGYTALSNE